MRFDSRKIIESSVVIQELESKSSFIWSFVKCIIAFPSPCSIDSAYLSVKCEFTFALCRFVVLVPFITRPVLYKNISRINVSVDRYDMGWHCSLYQDEVS